MDGPRWILQEVERTIYVIGGLPIALRGRSLPGSPAARAVRGAFARRYWRPGSFREAGELIIGLLLVPVAVQMAAFVVHGRERALGWRRDGKGLAAQFIEQLRLYALAGTSVPGTTSFPFTVKASARAPTFLQRCETKRGLYDLLRANDGSPLGQKDEFAARCASAGVEAVPCEMVVDGDPIDGGQFPECDLFVKPVEGRGGNGAERWDLAGARSWSNGRLTLGEEALAQYLRRKRRTLIVQKRIRPHAALASLTSGALPTVRVITCLDEQGRPEPVSAVFRMSIGSNRTVDNIHAGGLACSVSLENGQLGMASNLGMDARLGWCRDHPTTGARIEGTRLPLWGEVLDLATRAHGAFADRILIGWDIAITDDGPILVEGNRGPDMDLMQRFMDVGYCAGHRLTDLIAHHLGARGHIAVSPPPTNLMLRVDA